MAAKNKNGSKNGGSNGKKAAAPEGVWISPRHSLKGPAGERAWDNRPGGPPNSGRYLELADIAMGLKRPEPKQRNAVAAGAHVTAKHEPYSR
jgi:hypothetical protein